MVRMHSEMVWKHEIQSEHFEHDRKYLVYKVKMWRVYEKKKKKITKEKEKKRRNNNNKACRQKFHSKYLYDDGFCDFYFWSILFWLHVAFSIPNDWRSLLLLLRSLSFIFFKFYFFFLFSSKWHGCAGCSGSIPFCGDISIETEKKTINLSQNWNRQIGWWWW